MSNHVHGYIRAVRVVRRSRIREFLNGREATGENPPPKLRAGRVEFAFHFAETMRNRTGCNFLSIAPNHDYYGLRIDGTMVNVIPPRAIRVERAATRIRRFYGAR